MSIAIAWGPTALFPPGAVAQPAPLTLTPDKGPPKTPVTIGFGACTDETPSPETSPDESPHTTPNTPPETTPSEEGDLELGLSEARAAAAAGAPRAASIRKITWNGRTIGKGTSFVVPATAKPDTYTVKAYCSNGYTGSATFTVTDPEERDRDLTLAPDKGPPRTKVTATGSGFNCFDVTLEWDDGTRLTTTGVTDETFETTFSVPADASAKTHPVQARCTEYPEWYAEEDFEVTDEETSGNTTSNQTEGNTTDGNTTDGTSTDGTTTDGTTTDGNTTDGNTNGDTNGDTNGAGNGSGNGTNDGGSGGDTDGSGEGDTAVPVGWVVGPSLFAVLLLAALLSSLLHHVHRGPRWVHDHVRAALRSGSGTGSAELLRRRGSGVTPDRTVRLEPHPDHGDQRLD
ncbi:hypothetical protein [Streptomyces sp. MA5143a]|uniref:hypothetical protein n=1 Tax=Streptomyces sp. MA5143a TaxID=2083010 RepID=UPI000D1ADFB3|nr:hypothetical protein [Streptomyces sp. MA5143a]